MTPTPRKLGGKAAAILLGILLSIVCPLTAHAGPADNDQPQPDARMDGYPSSVAINEGGSGGTITFFVILMGITAGVMFMNAKRSHLD